MCSQNKYNSVVKAVVPFEASDIRPRLPHEKTRHGPTHAHGSDVVTRQCFSPTTCLLDQPKLRQDRCHTTEESSHPARVVEWMVSRIAMEHGCQATAPEDN